MSPLILLVDDEIEAMKYYVQALRDAGFEVRQLAGPDEVLEYLSGQDMRKPDFIILDTMMAQGNLLKGKPECERGLRTGVVLYPELRKTCPDTPCIVFTNLKKAEEDFEEIDPDLPVVQKVNCSTDELVAHVKAILIESGGN